MFEVRFHGRGGQGVVSAAELLSLAAFLEGKYAQAFPSFGSERMGAPVMSFCRLSAQPIRLSEPVMQPHSLNIQDATLLHQVNLFEGLTPEGCVLINTSKGLDNLGLEDLSHAFPQLNIRTVPATEHALKYLKRPIPNSSLLGAFSALTEVVRLESIIAALAIRFKEAVGKANEDAARAGFAYINQLTSVPEVTRAGAN